MANRFRRLGVRVILSAKAFILTFTFWAVFFALPFLLAVVAMFAWVFVAVIVFQRPMPGENTLLPVAAACLLATLLALHYFAFQRRLVQRCLSRIGLPVLPHLRQGELTKRNWPSLRELFPQVYLKWREPKLVRRAITRLEEVPRAQLAAITTGSLTGVMLGVWLLAWVLWRLTGKNEPMMRLVLVVPFAVGWGLFLFCVWVLWEELVPSVIKVTQVSISRGSASPVAHRYERIARCEIFTKQFDGFEARVLSIELTDGSKRLVGIADTVSAEELQRVLSERGVETSLHL